jgi:hypothetical protein
MLTETTHPGEFLLSEANGARSRENGVVAFSQTVGVLPSFIRRCLISLSSLWRLRYYLKSQ